MSIRFTAIPNGFEKLLEIYLVEFLCFMFIFYAHRGVWNLIT